VSVDLLLTDVRRRGDAAPLDIACDGGRIVAAGTALGLEAATTVDGRGTLVLPAFVNAHQHLDKTLLGDAFRPARWDGDRRVLRAVNRRHRETYTVDSILERADQVVELALRSGTTALRAFADIIDGQGTTGVQALVALRERWRGEVDIQVAGFPQDLIYDHHLTDRVERLFEEAIEAGMDIVAGMPDREHTEDLRRRHVDFCLALAQRHDRDLHFLLDDTDDPTHRMLEVLAHRVIHLGLEGRVTVGHVGALSAYDHTHAEDVIALVVEAGISVCVNPHISLTLQGWADRAPVRRGTTRVRELLAAGANVIAAQDDVDDPYYPIGRADLLEVAQYVAHVCHLLWPEQLETVADMVTGRAAHALRLDGYGDQVGDRADLVLLGAADLRSALAAMAPRPAVVSAGRVAVQTDVVVTRHARG